MKKLAFCLLFVGILVSCENSDDSNPIPGELEGKWELQSASCFCFFPEDFDFSGHKIDFDNDEGILTVEHSAETSFITAAGRYDFQFQNNMIVIKDIGQFTYEIMGDSLVMSFVDNPEIADDEITLTYKKIN